jgi:hypothetical protein
MDLNNHIKHIIDNIYISDFNIKHYETKLNDLNFKYIININKVINCNSCTTLNLNIDDLTKINFNETNDFIIYKLQKELDKDKKTNILICADNLDIPLIIMGIFLIQIINISFTETIYWLSRKTNSLTLSTNVNKLLFNQI